MLGLRIFFPICEIFPFEERDYLNLLLYIPALVKLEFKKLQSSNFVDLNSVFINFVPLKLPFTILASKNFKLKMGIVHYLPKKGH